MTSLEEMLQERIRESKRIHAELTATLPSHFPADDRKNLARCAISLALQHHAAITSLIQIKSYPSAQAMLRPLLEAGVIAYWILYAAKADKIEKISRTASLDDIDKKDDTPTLAEMLNQLEKSNPKLSGVEDLREAYKSPEGRWLNQYTHGGISLLRKMGQNQPGFNELEMHLSLLRADYFLLIAVHPSALIYRDENPAEIAKVSTQIQDFYFRLYDELNAIPYIKTDKPYKPLPELLEINPAK